MAIRSAVFSLLIGVLVLALKGGAWLLTASVALYSDALESVINVVAAGAAVTALWVASRPADDNHPFSPWRGASCCACSRWRRWARASWSRARPPC